LLDSRVLNSLGGRRDNISIVANGFSGKPANKSYSIVRKEYSGMKDKAKEAHEK
jgi:hypothetical protein